MQKKSGYRGKTRYLYRFFKQTSVEKNARIKYKRLERIIQKGWKIDSIWILQDGRIRIDLNKPA